MTWEVDGPLGAGDRSQPRDDSGRFQPWSEDATDARRQALEALITNVEYLMEEHGTRVIDIEDLRAVARDLAAPAPSSASLEEPR